MCLRAHTPCLRAHTPGSQIPAGLDTAQKPYREEAGATELLKTRLAGDPSLRKQLKEIPVLKKNLGTFVDELVAVGKKLGETEDERAHLLAASGPTDAGRVVAARNQWVRAVNAMLANAELAELDETTDRLIFGALRHADKMADRRKGTPQEVAEEPPAPAASPALAPAASSEVAPAAPPTR